MPVLEDTDAVSRAGGNEEMFQNGAQSGNSLYWELESGNKTQT